MEFKDANFKRTVEMRNSIPQTFLEFEVTSTFLNTIKKLNNEALLNYLEDTQTYTTRLISQRDLAEAQNDIKSKDKKQEELTYCFRVIDAIRKEIDSRKDLPQPPPMEDIKH